MSDDLTNTLERMRAYVDELGVELHDPSTTTERHKEIKDELRAMLQLLQQLLTEFG